MVLVENKLNIFNVYLVKVFYWDIYLIFIKKKNKIMKVKYLRKILIFKLSKCYLFFNKKKYNIND